MVKPNVDFDAVVEEWLGSQAGFKRYVNATENLYSAFTEGWCGPRRGLPDAFADFRTALLSESAYKHLRVGEQRSSRNVEN